MTHWEFYNTFEKLIFLIGYFAIVYRGIKITAWAFTKYDNWKIRKQAETSKNLDRSRYDKWA